MKRGLVLAVAVIAITGCRENPAPTEVRQEANKALIKCTLSGTRVTADRRGSETSPLAYITYYRMNDADSSIRVFDEKTTKYISACPVDRKCDISVKKAQITIASQMSDATGIVMVGRTDINRVTGKIRDYQHIDWLLSNRSMKSESTGSCAPSDEPKPLF